jgi:hypothetical protein
VTGGKNRIMIYGPKDDSANWLPIPKARQYYLGLRAYAPGPQTIASTYDPEVHPLAPIVQAK